MHNRHIGKTQPRVHNLREPIKSNIKIILWNCRSAKSKQMEISQLANNADVVICTETWLKPCDQFQFPGFSIYRKDRIGKKGGGILVLIVNKIQYKVIENLNADDLGAEFGCIQLIGTEEKIHIAPIYSHP